ncbi:MAG: hypothetical protein RSA89_06390, partial [Raoultibacter sp.]
GFPITALATGDTAAPKAEAPVTDAADADANTSTDAAPGATPRTPAPDGETPQAEAPATDAGTNPDAADSITNPPAPNVATPHLTLTPTPLAATPTVDPAAATGVAINETNFPDDIFRAYVRQEFDKNGNQTLEAGEIKAAKVIAVDGRGITTLKGIEYFTALNHLNCQNNSLKTLDLTNAPALTYLNCHHNQLEDLNVSANTALTWLQCYKNNLTTLDVSHNPYLTDLGCYNNQQLKTLDVSHNPYLTYLGCDNNGLKTLD